VKSKGIEDFVLLAEKLPTEYQVVLVGLTKEQKESLPSNIIGIQRTDSVHELAELYTVAEVFVNPTYEDNYPTTNLEALACGTPVVTYRTGGSIESVKETYGEIIEQGDIVGIYDCITSDRLKKKREAVYYMDRSMLDENEKFLQYYTLYKNILTSDRSKKTLLL
jgi:glycosyltransferase involved in cell wall biosynthesis